MGRFPEDDNMGKEDRKRQVLRLLVDSGFALPPAAIFRNAKLRGATFERRSVNNYLDELVDEGLVAIVDPDALEEGKIEESESNRGYFMATDAGVEAIESFDSN